MKILLFYENLNREYEVLTLLKHELQKRGHKVRISHYNCHDWGFLFLFSAPDIIATPWMRYDSNVARWACFRRWKGNTKIVNLQWEQVYSRKGIESGLTSIRGEALNAIHLCWGKRLLNRLAERGVSKHRLYVNGPMQFDMCRPQYRAYFKNRSELAAEFSLPNDEPWGLYISSFALATFRPEQLEQMKKEGGDYSDFADISRRSCNITLDWIEKFLEKYPEKILIYRPHPAENTNERITAMAKKYANFRVISKYSVKQWILMADRIGLWISTSSGELHALGKKYRIFRPEPLSDYYDLEYMINAKTFTDEQDFLDFFSGKTSDDSFPISEELLKEYYDFSPEVTSVKRTADIFEQIAASPEEQKFDLTSPEAVAFKKKLPKLITISLFASLYRFSPFKFSKLLPWPQLKRLDAFFDRERQAGQIRRRLISFLEKENL